MGEIPKGIIGEASEITLGENPPEVPRIIQEALERLLKYFFVEFSEFPSNFLENFLSTPGFNC